MRPYNPYANYMPGYNPCLEAAGYSVYNLPGSSGGETVPPMPLPTPMPVPNMPNMPNMPGMMPMPSMPNMPGIMPMPSMPNMPGMMPMPSMPNMSGVMPGGAMPGKAGVCPTGSVPYIVQEGDTLYNIARMYGTTVADILAANPSITEASILFIGQVVCVPIRAAHPCPSGSMTYTVVPGDTLTAIADRFSVSVYSLTVANPGFSVENLTPGTSLCIAPFACLPSCVESERYTIAKDEDLVKLAEKFQVTTDELLKANPFSPPCYFAPGNAICLPATAQPMPAAKHANR